MLNRRIKPIAAAVGAAFVTSLASANIADSNSDPFAANALDQGYVLVAKGHSEGKCGEGKAGEGKAGEGKCGEGKCGEGKAGEGKAGEGKCGEGKERKG
jgi:uncharacterized low-complexity protein